MADWKELLEVAGGKEFTVGRIDLKGSDISINGDFELPPLAKLSMDDQLFVAAFVKSHGSIKDMEKLFGVSYPTIKARLTRISKNFGFVDVEKVVDKSEILERLERGEISAEEAATELRK